MGRKTRKHKYLSALVALTLMAGGVAEARDHSVVSYNGHDVFDILYFDKADKGDWVERFWWSKDEVLVYNFSADMKTWMEKAGRQWAEILSPGLSSMKQPAQVIVGNYNKDNAFSRPSNYDMGCPADEDYFKGILVDGDKQDYIDFSSEESFKKLRYIGFASICIGQYMGADQNDGNYGWSGAEVGQLPQEEQTKSLVCTMFHELGHAFGIRSRISEGGFACDFYDEDHPDVIPKNFEAHLLDKNGNKAADGKVIVSDLSALDEETQKYVNENPEIYFVIADNKAYFTGDNVKKVLEGRKFEGKDGVPILAVEGGSVNLSHIELERSLMSHQNYRSYNTFMEAELALMQDIGYNIDRKNFYGRSIYNNDLKGEKAVKNTQGFFARNEAGTDYILGKANTATMGVGLHVYGSRNEITQTRDDDNEAGSADLLACGDGAAGIRIDGVENTVTLASNANIKADGLNGVGILAAYGRNHQINIEGNVSALGDGGDAVRFDFGSNYLGGNREYRGSYIRYVRYTTDGKISNSWNIGLQDDFGSKASFSDSINGDLCSNMGSLRISGKVEGRNHAIYIAKNAFVGRIDVENGAQISGDIVSEWKHFGNGLYDGGWGVEKEGEKKQGDKLLIQYGTLRHGYDEYCKDLVTNLNINGDFAYSGNITGTDNMKLKVNNGATMAYTGTADVVGVQVAEGAALYGGNYKVNEITKYASGESDNEAGKFINHGTIGPLNSTDKMVINGNFESDGIIDNRVGGTDAGILVSGTAELQNGSSVIMPKGGIAGEEIPVLKADKGVTVAENVQKQTVGLLSYVPYASEKDRNYIMAYAQARDSLEGATPQQMEDYNKLCDNALELKKDAGKEKELRVFYSLDNVQQAYQAMDEMKTNDKEDSTVAVLSAQGSTVNAKILSSRLATALGQSPAMMHIGANNLAEGDDSGVDVPVKLSTEQDNSAWVKFSRNWSRTAGGSNYTGNIITMGYDWKHGDNQRNGFFGSYTDSSYGHNDGSEKLQDTRFGYYTGIHKGADTQLLYADFGYLKGNRSRNAIFNSLGTNNLVKGDYTGWLVEIGGEWKHALHEIGKKTWQVSPYGAFQMSYMKQRGYSETGSLKAYDVSSGNNFYSALEGGVEFSRYMPKGSFNFRLGLRHALTGTGYEAHESNILGFFSKSSRMDKTHLVTSLAVETELAPRWQLGAELTFQKGAHDRDIMASLQLRRMW